MRSVGSMIHIGTSKIYNYIVSTKYFTCLAYVHPGEGSNCNHNSSSQFTDYVCDHCLIRYVMVHVIRQLMLERYLSCSGDGCCSIHLPYSSNELQYWCIAK